jgi:hypothetical protein
MKKAQIAEARQEHARDPIFADQLCAALDQPGKAIERPASEYLPAVARFNGWWQDWPVIDVPPDVHAPE